MTRRYIKTSEEVLTEELFPSGPTFRGVKWNISPILPTPLDPTPQATAYRNLNKNRVVKVNSWLGVPYGEPPTGDLRFKPCRPKQYEATEYDCTKFAPPPYQTIGGELQKDGRANPYGDLRVGALDWPGLGTHETEDCLNLTIYAPENVENSPVLFYIHGGGWTSYYGMTPHQFGGFMAGYLGVTVVLPDYRLSTFGHFPHPDILEEGMPSVAYSDIREALLWTASFINKFGGDGSNITISGSSAGGAACLMLLQDPEAAPYFVRAWVDSGGGSGNYASESFYKPRTALMGEVLKGMAPVLSTSLHEPYKSLQDALDDGKTIAEVLQKYATPSHIQAFADMGPIVDASSVQQVISGLGDEIRPAFRSSSDNVYPFRTFESSNAVEAAKAGRISKPLIISYAENEASVLTGGGIQQTYNYFNNLSASTLDGWAQRLGYNTYVEYANAWKERTAPFGAPNGLGDFNSSFYPTNQYGETEMKRALYQEAVYGYPAWRIARAMAENGHRSWLVLNNFSANGQFAGHSGLTPLQFFNTDWVVAGLQNFPEADPPGTYPNARMDVIMQAAIHSYKMAKFCREGDPNGSSDVPETFVLQGILPANGGNRDWFWEEYDLDNPGHHNVTGRYIGPIDTLNGYDPNINSQRDVNSRWVGYKGGPYLDYLQNLEG